MFFLTSHTHEGGQALIDKEQGAIIEVIKKEVTEAEKNMDNRFG